VAVYAARRQLTRLYGTSSHPPRSTARGREALRSGYLLTVRLVTPHVLQLSHFVSMLLVSIENSHWQFGPEQINTVSLTAASSTWRCPG
jgi:hypothetical protein